MTELLHVDDLRVRFRISDWLRRLFNPGSAGFIEAVSGVSFRIDSGETFGLVGESGSGKTTLGRAVIGLTRPDGGRIRFEGQDIGGLGDRAYRPVRRRMAMMFQDPVGCLSPRLRVRSILAQPLRIHGLPAPPERINELLAMVGLPQEFGDRYPHQLSGGQARRVGLARALALSPRLIIADEPTAGLDVSIQGDILNLLGRMQRETGVSVLAITHNLAVIRHISDRMAIMYLGRFVEMGHTEEIFAHPRHPYTHALLSANPVPDPDAELNRVELKGDVPSLLNRPNGCEFHTRCPFQQPLCQEKISGCAGCGNGPPGMLPFSAVETNHQKHPPGINDVLEKTPRCTESVHVFLIELHYRPILAILRRSVFNTFNSVTRCPASGLRICSTGPGNSPRRRTSARP